MTNVAKDLAVFALGILITIILSVFFAVVTLIAWVARSHGTFSERIDKIKEAIANIGKDKHQKQPQKASVEHEDEQDDKEDHPESLPDQQPVASNKLCSTSSSFFRFFDGGSAFAAFGRRAAKKAAVSLSKRTAA